MVQRVVVLTAPTSLAVDTVRPPALRRPGARTTAVVVYESGWTGQNVRHAFHTVEKLVADLRVGVPEVAVRTRTTFAGLRVLWNGEQVRQDTAEQFTMAVTCPELNRLPLLQTEVRRELVRVRNKICKTELIVMTKFQTHK